MLLLSDLPTVAHEVHGNGSVVPFRKVAIDMTDVCARTLLKLPSKNRKSYHRNLVPECKFGNVI